jgi:sulfate/thiosulfate transport system ATP-binding protein
MSLRIEALSRHAVSRRVLDRVSLEVGSGEFLTLLGPAGSGRASLLRVVAGLEEADSGRVLVDGRDVTRLPPARRGVRILYQHDPLYGHPTVFEAVSAALPGPEGDGRDGDGRRDPADRAAQVRHLLGLVGLGRDEGWMPATLPPAKRHRLALARALASGPRVLLVGEAFGLAHAGPRPAPRRWLLDLHRRLGLTTVLVAHGPAEALALGDRIAVMNHGRVEQIGAPEEVRRRPASGFVAQCLGAAAVPRAPTAAAAAWDEAPFEPGAAVLAQGHLLSAQPLEVVEADHGAPARVLGATAHGATLRLALQLLADGTQLEAEVPHLGAARPLPPGTIIGVRPRVRGARGGALN